MEAPKTQAWRQRLKMAQVCAMNAAMMHVDVARLCDNSPANHRGRFWESIVKLGRRAGCYPWACYYQASKLSSVWFCCCMVCVGPQSVFGWGCNQYPSARLGGLPCRVGNNQETSMHAQHHCFTSNPACPQPMWPVVIPFNTALINCLLKMSIPREKKIPPHLQSTSGPPSLQPFAFRPQTSSLPLFSAFAAPSLHSPHHMTKG